MSTHDRLEREGWSFGIARGSRLGGGVEVLEVSTQDDVASGRRRWLLQCNDCGRSSDVVTTAQFDRPTDARHACAVGGRAAPRPSP